jgi:hypothetical protein
MTSVDVYSYDLPPHEVVLHPSPPLFTQVKFSENGDEGCCDMIQFKKMKESLDLCRLIRDKYSREDLEQFFSSLGYEIVKGNNKKIMVTHLYSLYAASIHPAILCQMQPEIDTDIAKLVHQSEYKRQHGIQYRKTMKDKQSAIHALLDLGLPSDSVCVEKTNKKRVYDATQVVDSTPTIEKECETKKVKEDQEEEDDFDAYSMIHLDVPNDELHPGYSSDTEAEDQSIEGSTLDEVDKATKLSVELIAKWRDYGKNIHSIGVQMKKNSETVESEPSIEELDWVEDQSAYKTAVKSWSTTGSVLGIQKELEQQRQQLAQKRTRLMNETNGLMKMLSPPCMECGVCQEPYNTTTRFRVVTECGHVYCHFCLSQKTISHCPTCRRKIPCVKGNKENKIGLRRLYI